MARCGSATVSSSRRLDSRRQHRVEARNEVPRAGPGGYLLQGELDDVVAAQPGDQLRGEPRAMILPWSMIATRSQSRSASSM